MTDQTVNENLNETEATAENATATDTNEAVNNEDNVIDLNDIMAGVETAEGDEEPVELTVEQKLAKAEEDLLRSLADMQNTRRIAENDVLTARKYGVAPLARDLFMVAQNLRLALMSISDEDKENNPAFKNLALGLDMVANEFDSAFSKNKITKILPKVGDDFDHDTHQVMGEVETDEVDGGKIAQVLSAGYMLHDRLLKPAMVNTAKK